MSEPEQISSEAVEPTILKVPASGGKSFNEIQRDTDRAIAKNAHRFVTYLASDIAEIEKMLKKYLNNPVKENMRPIFNRVHNLRGQGTLFDYPLVTTIGGHFCRYIDNLPDDVTPRQEVIVTFINSLKVIQTEEIKGEGTKNFKILEENMRIMVDKIISDFNAD